MVFQFGCLRLLRFVFGVRELRGLRLFRLRILLRVLLSQLHRLQGARLIEAARDPLQDVFLPEPPFLFRCRGHGRWR